MAVVMFFLTFLVFGVVCCFLGRFCLLQNSVAALESTARKRTSPIPVFAPQHENRNAISPPISPSVSTPSLTEQGIWERNIRLAEEERTRGKGLLTAGGWSPALHARPWARRHQARREQPSPKRPSFKDKRFRSPPSTPKPNRRHCKG